MLTKKFLICQMSNEPIQGDVFGYVMIARDGELWRVGRAKSPEAGGWKLGQVVDVPIQYIGPDHVAPDWKRIESSYWEFLKAPCPYEAVAKFFGRDVADRFVTQDEGNRLAQWSRPPEEEQ
jgi:hypothetical protein